MSDSEPVLLLAPLHGVTNRFFRQAFFQHFAGFDGALAPFILSVSSSNPSRIHFKDVLPENNPLLPVIPQLLSNDAASFVDSARFLADVGHTEVNWNLGCPFPPVANKTRGSGLLPFPERIGKFLDHVCPRVTVRISVKLRLGRYDAAEILDVMPVLNHFPLARVIIHPRIATQMYEGDVDLAGFARAAELCAHPLVFNGDIRNPATYRRLARRFPGVRQWMIGRWAVSNPFLPAQIKTGQSPEAPLPLVRAFHDTLYAAYRAALHGPAHVLDKLKEVWSCLEQSFPDDAPRLRKITRAKTLEAFETAVAEIFLRGTWRT